MSIDLTKAARALVRRLPGFPSLDRYLARRYCGLPQRERFPRGHYYSPLPDVADIQSRAGVLFCRNVGVDRSIDVNEASQKALLEQLAVYLPEFDWPEQQCPDRRYSWGNTFFGLGSAMSLYAMMRYFAPQRVVEIGSGYSSAMMLDTSERFLRSSVSFTFVEPYPQRLFSVLRPGDRERCRIIENQVQNVAVTLFEEFEENDFLFVDSSHVAKVGSDVNQIVFRLLPALKRGTIIHFHDIFWPFEYPEEWIAQGYAWNEAYVLRSFLQYNKRFEILQFNDFLSYRFPTLLENVCPLGMAKFGSSLWLRKR